MRINPKIFTLADGATPIEVQEFDGRKVELFYLDDYEEAKNEFIAKSQFAVWSSIDGVNYRVYIESGYYNAVKALYQQPINKIWVDFWDTTENITKKTSRRILIPMMVVCCGLCIGSFFVKQDWASYAIIGVLILAFICMIVVNSFTRKKVMEANIKSRNEISDFLGQNQFDDILKKQKEYIDEYYDKLYQNDNVEEDDEALEADEPQEEAKALEKTEDVVVEEKTLDDEASKGETEVLDDENKETNEAK
ncbi:MAG: hypothetical protein IKP12_05125 [Acholeplasmatales bacterium]|nr:hypothetical protein [Acholeplasmatales bacterium]